MSFVRTILGDIKPEDLGLTYSHEHIVIEEGYATHLHPDFLLNDTTKISSELNEFYDNGGRTVVDTMPINCGRNVLKSVAVSKQSGVNILLPTGLHLEYYYPPGHWRYQLTEEQLTELFIRDITVGIDLNDYNGPVVERSGSKAGLIKLATGNDKFNQHQQMIFRAVVNAHLETGAPILTHTNEGLQALEQALLFDQLGADPDHVVLSHVDRRVDVEYHKKVLDTGVRIEYDSAFRWKNGQENGTMKLLKALLPNYSEQIVLGMDTARNTYWRAYGGEPGLSYLLTTFKKELEAAALGEYYKKLFYQVPQQLFSFRNV